MVVSGIDAQASMTRLHAQFLGWSDCGPALGRGRVNDVNKTLKESAMRKLIGGLALFAVMGVWAAPAVAQIGQIPVYAAPAGYAGLRISGDWGMGANSDSKWEDSSPMTFGGMIGFGGGMFNINAGAGYVDPKAETLGLKKPISFGGNVGVTLVKPSAQSPLAVGVFAGAGYTNYKTDGDADVLKQLDVPFGVSVGFSPAMSGNVGFEVWAAPRGVYSSQDYGTKFNRFGFGASGGVNVNFAMGFGIHAAVDWSTYSEKTVEQQIAPKYSPLLIGAGLHYTFKMPS